MSENATKPNELPILSFHTLLAPHREMADITSILIPNPSPGYNVTYSFVPKKTFYLVRQKEL